MKIKSQKNKSKYNQKYINQNKLSNKKIKIKTRTICKFYLIKLQKVKLQDGFTHLCIMMGYYPEARNLNESFVFAEYRICKKKKMLSIEYALKNTI